MIPKTKKDKAFVSLDSKAFKDSQCKVSANFKKWVENKVVVYPAYITNKKKDTLCMSCHSTFTLNKHTKCPHCHKSIYTLNGRGGRIEDRLFVSRLYRVGEQQVVRNYVVRCVFRKNLLPYINISEIGRLYIDEHNNRKYMSLALTFGSTIPQGYYDYAREENPNKSLAYRIELRDQAICPKIDAVYPYGGTTKWATKIGVRNLLGAKNVTNPLFVISDILKNSKLETILKSKKNYKLFDYESDVNRRWASLKIAFRHNYHPKSKPWHYYFDYLTMLDNLGLDLLNSKYICPSNLADAHDSVMKRLDRKNEVEARKQALEQARLDETSQERYLENKGSFLNLRFAKDNLTIVPLKSIEEFAEEGNEMKHCVFSSKYYDKEDSLVFSAKLDGKRVETIEYSLSKSQIRQAYGYCNKVQDAVLHQKIEKLIIKNTNLISTIYENSNI